MSHNFFLCLWRKSLLQLAMAGEAPDGDAMATPLPVWARKSYSKQSGADILIDQPADHAEEDQPAEDRFTQPAVQVETPEGPLADRVEEARVPETGLAPPP